MNAAPRRGRLWRVVALVTAALGLGGFTARAFAQGSTMIVAVLAPHESRLADEIKRELESSRFEVLSAEVGARRWQDAAREVNEGHLLRGVAVEADDRTITVYTRLTASSPVETRLVLSVDPADRMARRHAALSVVEFLHALGQATPALPPDADEAAPASGLGAHGRATTPFGAARPAPSPGAGRDAGPTGSSLSPTPANPSSRPGWQLGVGTSFDVETSSGGPTSHLQFLGVVPFSPHVAICVRALWPLLAAQSRNNGNDVRAWTFGAAGSLQYTFQSSHRLRSFMGVGLGTRLGLTETTSMTATQSGQTFATSATLGVEAGVRYAVTPFLQVFFELAAARAWLIPPVDNVNYERAAANGESARASVGVMFES